MSVLYLPHTQSLEHTRNYQIEVPVTDFVDLQSADDSLVTYGRRWAGTTNQILYSIVRKKNCSQCFAQNAVLTFARPSVTCYRELSSAATFYSTFGSVRCCSFEVNLVCRLRIRRHRRLFFTQLFLSSDSFSFIHALCVDENVQDNCPHTFESIEDDEEPRKD